MTPTEQDKELREKVTSILGKWGLNDDPDYGLPIELLDLITADRKRVALEARIDELLHLVDESSDTNWKANAWFSVRDRMAELKAQQEEGE